MPSIQVTGQLVDPTTGVEGSADIRIASLINYGQTTKKSISHESTDASGNYDFQLVHGKHLIFVKYEDERIYIPIGYAVVGGSTPDPIDIIQLINLSDENPPSELVTELQQLREDTLNDIVSTSAEVLENAGYKGLWPDTGGGAIKGETYQTQVGGTPTGEYYTALKNTSADPVGDNVNWKVNIGVNNVTLNFATVSEAASSNSLKLGCSVEIAERNNAVFDVVDTSSVTPNGFDIIQCTGLTELSLKLRVDDRIDLLAFGCKFGIDSPAAFQRAFFSQAEYRVPIYINPTPLADFICSAQVEYQGWGLYGGSAEASKIIYTGSTVFIKKQQSNDFGQMHDFSIFGPGNSASGSQCFGHDGNTRGWFRTQMKNVRVNAFERAFEVQLSLFCTFDTVFIRDCNEGFFFIGGGAGWNNTWYNNGITFTNCVWDECYMFAVDFVGASLSFTGTNTMQSGGDGIRIKRDDSDRSRTNTLDNLYFEFNTGKDIDLKDTYVTMGPVVFQSGPVNTPGHNIFADNSEIYATGRPVFLDNPALRIELTNNSKYVAMYYEIVSNKIIKDSTSEFVYMPTRLSDKRLEQTLTNLGASPKVLAAPIGSSGRYTNHTVEFIIEAPNGDYTGFTTYGKLASGSYRTGAVAGDATKVSDSEFTVSVGGVVYTFRTVGANGTITVEADSSTSGDTVITTRVVNSRANELY